MNVNKEKNSLIVRLSGEIDHHSAKDIKDETDSMFEGSNAKNLILDFSDVDFMDSSGVGFVIGRYKAVSKTGGKIAVTGVSGTIDRVMDISGVYKIMKRYKTPEDALNAIEK